jgi:hypothetical protein
MSFLLSSCSLACAIQPATRAIARALNAEHVAGPRGRWWGPLTLVGNRKRGNGILNNELYIGRMVWNRQRFIKDPDSRKRQARPNPPEAWITIDVPSLRIVDEQMWNAVKARQGALNTRILIHRRRPQHLLSGLIKCGCCGSGMSVLGQGWIGCTSARDRGTCDNRRTIKRQELEARILRALQHELMRPELFEEFCAEYTREINRLRMEKTADIRAQEVDLAKVTRELDKLIDALIQGAVHLFRVMLNARRNHGNLVRHNLGSRDGSRQVSRLRLVGVADNGGVDGRRIGKRRECCIELTAQHRL